MAEGHAHLMMKSGYKKVALNFHKLRATFYVN
mgnify:CR=1 FL=1|jgi:hypothetical protein